MPTIPKIVLVVYHRAIAGSANFARTIIQDLQANGIRAEMLTVSELPTATTMTMIDMMIAVGGDGTMLRASRVAAGMDIPVLGVNMGHLGFLLEVTPNDWKAALAQICLGEYWLEPRRMVMATHLRDGVELGTYHALNEMVIARGGQARPVRLRTQIDREMLTTYLADGLIISTATGSTAYALAAGGPILPPTLPNLVLIPVAPHLSVDRAIVLAEGTVIDVQVFTHHQALLSSDGHADIHLRNGDAIRIESSHFQVEFVRIQDKTYFYRNITARLVFSGERWGEEET
jgi:NAD+ kinase